MDIGDRSPDGSFGYEYNYLDYFFLDEKGEEQLIARAYLDEIGKVYVKKLMKDLRTPFMQDILCYLHLRFARIVALDAKQGYCDLEEGIAAPIENRMRDFLAHSEETM